MKLGVITVEFYETRGGECIARVTIHTPAHRTETTRPVPMESASPAFRRIDTMLGVNEIIQKWEKEYEQR